MVPRFLVQVTGKEGLEEKGWGVGGACVRADGNREVGFGLGGSETLARHVQEAADIQVWSLQEKVRSLWHIDDI